jgi:hypothetical protein
MHRELSRKLVRQGDSFPHIGDTWQRTGSCAPATAATIPTQTISLRVSITRHRLDQVTLELRNTLLVRLLRHQRYQLQVPVWDQEGTERGPTVHIVEGSVGTR